MWPFRKFSNRTYNLAHQQNEVKLTPDYGMLELQQAVNIFVCDEMMQRHHKHSMLGEPEFLGVAFTMHKFSMWKKKLGKASFPIPLEGTKDLLAPPYRIRGELYAIRPKCILDIDKDKINGVLFQRKRVKLVLPHHSVVKTKMSDVVITTSVKHVLLSAWMYVGISERWEPDLDGGYLYSPVKHYKFHNNPLGNYYQFTTLEYNDK